MGPSLNYSINHKKERSTCKLSTRKVVAVWSAFLLVLIGASFWSFAQPAVNGAKVYRFNNAVVCDVTCDGIFTDEIVGTVQSGLPVLVEIAGAVAADTLFMHGQAGDDNIKAEAGLETSIGLVLAGDGGEASRDECGHGLM